MNVAAYYRVSSTQQREKDTIAAQRSAAHALLDARGWTLVAEHEDDGRSATEGKLDKRTGFAALLAGARARRFEAVIVGAVDRLTRAGDLGEMGLILGTFQRAGVRIITTSGEEIDYSTRGGRISGVLRSILA